MDLAFGEIKNECFSIRGDYLFINPKQCFKFSFFLSPLLLITENRGCGEKKTQRMLRFLTLIQDSIIFLSINFCTKLVFKDIILE